jgi:hypothetical protein
MDKKETVYLSQFEAIQVLWPGDVRALAEFRASRSNSRQESVSIREIGAFGLMQDAADRSPG